jgi:murein L,D-transpeptidase YcbB/YkuD
MRLAALRASLLLMVITALLSVGCGKKVDNSQHTAALRTLMSTTPAWVDKGAIGRTVWAAQKQFYEARGYLPAWVDGDRTTPQMKDLFQQLHYSEKHGLDPAAYGVAQFEELRDASQEKYKGTRFEPAEVPELDARMTYAYLRYAADLLAWGAKPRDVYVNWLVDPKKEDLAARLEAAVAKGTVRDSLEELAPTHPQYRGLQAALVRELANPTGKEEQLRMNLERWRWAPHDMGDRYVLINVPAYQMQVMEADKPALAMRVIVGAPATPTPLFSDEMTYVIFSPYWNIPESILREETLPRLARDPDYLRRNNLEVVGTSGTVDASGIDWSDESALSGLRLRQAPGPENALGLVKFIFPNHFNVYLHDTPGDRLFFKDARALSHGCIRIENPVGMAKYVMRERPDWDEPRIVRAMNSQEEQTVTLKQKLPVHIGYWTAWVDADGQVIYTDDPYGIDAAHARLRTGARPRPVTGQPTGA